MASGGTTVRDGVAWLAVGLGVGLGAVIAAVDTVPSGLGAPPTGMGRAESSLDEVWALSVGQSVDVDVEGLRWRVTLPSDGTYRVAELFPDGSIGRIGVMSPTGEVRLNSASAQQGPE
jgi:hypothetical protein